MTYSNPLLSTSSVHSLVKFTSELYYPLVDLIAFCQCNFELMSEVGALYVMCARLWWRFVTRCERILL